MKWNVENKLFSVCDKLMSVQSRQSTDSFLPWLGSRSILVGSCRWRGAGRPCTPRWGRTGCRWRPRTGSRTAPPRTVGQKSTEFDKIRNFYLFYSFHSHQNCFFNLIYRDGKKVSIIPCPGCLWQLGAQINWLNRFFFRIEPYSIIAKILLKLPHLLELNPVPMDIQGETSGCSQGSVDIKTKVQCK